MSTALEIVAPDETALAIAKEANVTPEVASGLSACFAPMFAGARGIILKSKAIVVTDASHKLETKLAREYRLALKALRVEAEKTKKSLKEDSLRRGRAIDGFYNILLEIIAPEEARLEEQEKFLEIKEQERKAALKVEREAALKPFGIDPAFYSLADMPDETWAQLIENTKVAHEAKLAAARKAEDERIARENAELKERERVREENERLKREAAAAEEAARVERARVEEEQKAAAEKARLEREEIERKAQAEKDAIRKAAEAKAKAERAKVEADRKAAAEAAEKENLRIKQIAEVERQKAEAARITAEENARVEREAREKLEAEALAVKQAAEKAEAERIEAARQAALAPDREKLLAYAAALSAVELPDVASEDAKIVRDAIKSRVYKLDVWIKAEAQVL